ncbi:MAG: T9SS type A sorting domain-containing protein [Bacteroidota bacterium]
MAERNLTRFTVAETIRKWRPYLIFLRLVSISLIAKGGHIAGSEIGYRTVQPGRLEVNYAIYTDENGGCPGTLSPLEVKSEHCNLYFSILLQLTTPAGVPMGPSCASAINGVPHFTKWVYSGIVNLPSACDDWKLSANECCRSSEISSIQSPEQSAVYTEAWINAAVSNPTQLCFNSLPDFLLWSGQTNRRFILTGHSGLDSVVVSPIPTRVSSSDNVSYLTGYSPSTPIRMSSSIQIERQSGSYSCLPTSDESGVLTVRATGYLNGQPVTSIEREQRIVSLPQTNSLPVASGFNGSNSYENNVCSGGRFTSFIQLSDVDPGDNPAIIDFNGPQSFHYTMNGNTLQLDWQVPSVSADTSFVFGIRISDQQCPAPGVQDYAYVLHAHVNRLPSSNPVTVRDASCSNGADGAIEMPASGLSVYWSNGAIGNRTERLAPGMYYATVSDPSSGCEVTYPAGVGFRHLSPQVDLGMDRVVCQGSVVMLDAGGPYASYDWSDGSRNSNLTAVTSGYYHVTVTDAYGCTGVSGTNVQFQLCSGIASEQEQASLQIYPNPADDYLMVRLPQGMLRSDWFITDETGRVVMESETPIDQDQKIHLEHISPGVYFITLHAESGIKTKRFIRS